VRERVCVAGSGRAAGSSSAWQWRPPPPPASLTAPDAPPRSHSCHSTESPTHLLCNWI
jgi:hypothetical protein